MLANLRNIFTVIVVTCLIWLFAEAESLRPVQSAAEITFVAEPGSNLTIDVSDPVTDVRLTRVRVTIDLEGSAAAIDTVEQLLRKSITLSPGMEGVAREPGERLINLRDALRNHPDIRSRGITIKKVDPPEVKVVVDELETRNIKIVTSISADDLDGAVELSPVTVGIRLTKSEAARLTDASAAIAKIDADTIESLTRGRRVTIPHAALQLPAELAAASHASLLTRVCDVTLTLKPQTRSIKVASVPVHIRMAPGELGKWDIDIPEQDRFLTDVTISGPNELVNAVEAKTMPVLATVSLSFEELEKPIVSKEAVFTDLSTGLKADAANKTVRLTIKRRAAEKKPS